MRRGIDTLVEAAKLLQGKVRHIDLRPQQTLSDDGEATQPRSGGCRHCLCEHECRGRDRIYASREGNGKGCDKRSVQPCDTRMARGTAIHGTPTLFHYGQERAAVRPSIPATEQLACQESMSVWQLQHDQHRRDIPQDGAPGSVATHLQRLLHHPRADGSPP